MFCSILDVYHSGIGKETQIRRGKKMLLCKRLIIINFIFSITKAQEQTNHVTKYQVGHYLTVLALTSFLSCVYEIAGLFYK